MEPKTREFKSFGLKIKIDSEISLCEYIDMIYNNRRQHRIRKYDDKGILSYAYVNRAYTQGVVWGGESEKVLYKNSCIPNHEKR